jgi:aminoglycoside phosphotransferase (APT) family kinase protein
MPTADGPLVINEALVRRLVDDQFPQWAGLPVRPVSQSGWHNRCFHLGDAWLVRLPSAHDYEAQIHTEQTCLPYLRSHLPLHIPEPVALGRPGRGYPWAWSVYTWLPGESANAQAPEDVAAFTRELGQFLSALYRVPAKDGPTPGAHNFHRGGSLKVYDEQFRQALQVLSGAIDTASALQVWESAIASTWRHPPVWVHGDISLGNLLICNGRLCAVIDFGLVCVDDPACDLAIAWTFLSTEHRQEFQRCLALDADTWQRGRAWALWKAAIVAAGLAQTNAVEGQVCWRTIAEVLNDAGRHHA